jgi:hypothetical protein
MKDRDQLWGLIKDNLTALLTITSAIIVIVLRQLKVVPDTELLIAILGILTLLATTELIDRSRKLDRIEKAIEAKFQQVVSTLEGVEIHAFSTSASAFEFISQNILDAETSIDHAALAPSVPRWPNQYKRYEDAIAKVLKGNRIRYRYLALLPEKHRLERIAKYLNDPNIKQYFAKYLKDWGGNSFHNFMVFDEKLAVVNFPYEPGEPEKFLAIRHRDIVEFYLAIFTHFWKTAQILDNQELTQLQSNESRERMV